MANELFRLQALFVNDESSFAAGTYSALTYDTRLPFISATVNLEWPRESDLTVRGRKNDSGAGYLMLQNCSLEIETYIPGTVTDPGTGAPTANWFYTLLKDGLGGGLAADDGGTIDSATDADTFVTTGVTALTPGAPIFVGTKGSGGCDGQCGIVSTWAAGSTQLLNALPATPTAADAVRTALTSYPTEADPTVTKRFLLIHKNTGAMYQMLGCQLDSISIDWPSSAGAPVKATLRYRGVAWSQEAADTPASLSAALGTALPACDQSPIAGGSFICQDFGTATRSAEQPASLSLTLSMGLLPMQGPAVDQRSHTNVYGWVSQGCVPTITYTIPWNATKFTEWQSDGSSTTHKQILALTSGVAAKRFGFYMPRAYPVGQPPTRTEMNGQHYITCTYKGAESTVTTSELTRSAIRFFQG